MSEQDVGLMFGFGVIVGVALSAIVSFIVDFLNHG